jgi:hypothetical protein
MMTRIEGDFAVTAMGTMCRGGATVELEAVGGFRARLREGGAAEKRFEGCLPTAVRVDWAVGRPFGPAVPPLRADVMLPCRVAMKTAGSGKIGAALVVPGHASMPSQLFTAMTAL